MSALAWLAGISGTIGGLASIPQVIKIFVKKNAKGVALTTYLILICVSTVWILYGLELRNIPILLTNGIGFVSFSLVIVGWILYGRDR